MSTIAPTKTSTDRRSLLSTLWVFVLLNIVFRDIHEFFRPGAIEEFIAQDVTEGTLLLAAVGLELGIAMVVLARVLPHRINRWVNVGVGAATLAAFAANPPGDLDDLWFMAFEVAGLIAIIWLAWQWRTTKPHGLEAST